MEELAQAIKKAADEFGPDVQFRNGYSGRGMYGSQCVALVGSFNQVMGTLALVEEVDDRITLAEDAQMDTMGYDVVMYWSRVEPIEGLVDEDDEEGEW